MGLIYLDACLPIYLVGRHPRWCGTVAAAIARASQGLALRILAS